MEFITLMKKVKAARLQNDFTQEYMAERCGITQSAYNYIENGKRHDVGIMLFLRMAKALNVSVCDWLNCKQSGPVGILNEEAAAYSTATHNLALTKSQLSACETRVKDLMKLIESKEETISALEAQLKQI